MSRRAVRRSRESPPTPVAPAPQGPLAAGAPPAERRRLALALAIATLVALALRSLGLAHQPLTGDDALAGLTARNFVEFGWPDPMMWNHPRLRDHLIHWSTGALGGGAWGLKIWSVLLGTLAVPATGWMVWLVSSSAPAAVVSAAIVAADPLHVDFSRQAVNDVYLSFFPVAAIVALLMYAERRRAWQLLAAGALLALAIDSKWSAAFPVAAALAVVIQRVVAAARERSELIADGALAAAALVLLPVAVYVLTYWPWFGRGYGLAEFVRFQRAMGSEAATHVGMVGSMIAGYPGRQVHAALWFVQPVWWVDYIPQWAQAGIPSGGLFLPGVGNPVTWLAALPAAAWAAWRWLAARDRGAGTLLLLWAAAYLPFVAVPRPIFSNSAVTVVPFWAALVGLAATRAWARARPLVVAWGAAAAVAAALLWLPATGRAVGAADALVRTIVSPPALDAANHPVNRIYGVDARL